MTGLGILKITGKDRLPRTRLIYNPDPVDTRRAEAYE